MIFVKAASSSQVVACSSNDGEHHWKASFNSRAVSSWVGVADTAVHIMQVAVAFRSFESCVSEYK